MTDVRIGDLWQYCEINFYIVTKVDDIGVDLEDIESIREYTNYPLKTFEKTHLWKLLSRPAGLVEQ